MAGICPDCSICDHIYDETERKPLVLLCGHTYCQQCLHDVVSGGSPACPSCRKEIVSPVNELPVVFALIPPTGSDDAASKGVAMTKMFCSTHQNELDYWCSQCKVLICKRCLVQTHAKHELILAEEIFADGRTLSHLKSQINANLQQLKASIYNLQQFESLAGFIDEVKSSVPLLKKAVLKQESILNNFLKVLEGITSEPSLEQKNLILKMLKDQNQMQFKEVNISKAPKPFQDQGVQCQIIGSANGSKDKPTEKYMPDGHPWFIISPELAEKALCTMKETGHRTPKATVISTDESPILCLQDLLQYLAASSAAMELQLMDTAGKAYKKDWLPLKAGGEKSTNFNHRYRLKTLAGALTAIDDVANDAAENKVIILVYPPTRTYDVCVLAFGEVVRSDTGSWPLPLEVHVVGWSNNQHREWVKCILPSLYYIAQPGMRECRVYLPGYNSWYPRHTSPLCSVLAELGQKFSTQHRLYLPCSYPDRWKPDCRQAAEEHKLALEFRDW